MLNYNYIHRPSIYITRIKNWFFELKNVANRYILMIMCINNLIEFGTLLIFNWRHCWCKGYLILVNGDIKCGFTFMLEDVLNGPHYIRNANPACSRSFNTLLFSNRDSYLFMVGYIDLKFSRFKTFIIQ